MDTPAIARILSRYIGSMLVTYGFISPEYSAGLDADLALLLGAVLSGAAELWFILAKKWKKQ